MVKPFYNSQSLSFEGFKNCIRYASVNFDSSFNISSKFSKNNFMDTVIKDFVQKLKAFDLNLFDVRPGGTYKTQEFLIFRDSVISGKVPTLRLKFIDPRLVILALVSCDDEVITYSYIIEDSSNNCKDFRIKNSFFATLELTDNRAFFFNAVRFVILSTVGGINCLKQTSIVLEAYTKVARYDSDAYVCKIDIIFNFFAIIREKFLENSESSIYVSNQNLIRLFKHSGSNAFNDINIRDAGKVVKFFKFDPLIGDAVLIFNKVSYEPSTFLDVSTDNYSIEDSSDFSPLREYCEYLTVRFYEYIFNRVETGGEFIFCLEDDIKSCLVDANNAHTLSSYFESSLNNVNKLNASAMGCLDLMPQSSLLDNNLLISNFIMDFRVSLFFMLPFLP
ncbi:hypothetical protein AB834_03700 [PVC group bacterium (ex Bugula neritina AB1)]|nr:hypothetical protein AB834_03700 [PVC group bacterium (ex Bugula neritina AB1)]